MVKDVWFLVELGVGDESWGYNVELGLRLQEYVQDVFFSGFELFMSIYQPGFTIYSLLKNPYFDALFSPI